MMGKRKGHSVPRTSGEANRPAKCDPLEEGPDCGGCERRHEDLQRCGPPRRICNVGQVANLPNVRQSGNLPQVGGFLLFLARQFR